MNHMQGMSSAGHNIHVDNTSADAKTRMRSARAAAPTFMPMQKAMNGTISNAHGGAVPGGVFGKKKGWADQIADDEALQAQPMVPMGMRPVGHMPNLNNSSSRQLPFVLPSAAIISKPPSPVDNVKFVNSTVENLQSQIKKEEAPKKKRTRTSPEQLRILQKAFATDPMPSSQARLALSKKLGMNPRAVQVWFQNRRAKAKRAEALGLSGQMDDDIATGSEEDDEMSHLDTAAGQLHHYQQHSTRQQKLPSRAASMSAYIPMGYASAMDHNSCYGLQPNQAAAFFDPSTFMEPVENVFDPDMALPGLDFSLYGGYGAPSTYAMPMQGMFSLPMSSYDQPGPHAASYGYPPVVSGGQYPSYPDEVSLNDAVLGRFETDENNALGPINPLSALLDAHNLEARQHYANGKDDFSMANARYSNNQSPSGGSVRRSYSLNDIHAQLTTQQIQTLESIGLPALGPGPSKTTLGCIREEDDTGAGTARHVSTGSPDYSATTGVDQDQLLSTIDDLRMDSFWDTTAPNN